MKEVLHHVEESWVWRLGHVLETVRDLVVSVTAASRCRRHDTRQHALYVVTGRLLQGDRRPREIPQMKHLCVRDDEPRQRRTVTASDRGELGSPGKLKPSHNDADRAQPVHQSADYPHTAQFLVNVPINSQIHVARSLILWSTNHGVCIRVSRSTTV